jgi:hypothetical protein
MCSGLRIARKGWLNLHNRKGGPARHISYLTETDSNEAGMTLDSAAIASTRIAEARRRENSIGK